MTGCVGGRGWDAVLHYVTYIVCPLVSHARTSRECIHAPLLQKRTYHCIRLLLKDNRTARTQQYPMLSTWCTYLGQYPETESTPDYRRG